MTLNCKIGYLFPSVWDVEKEIIWNFFFYIFVHLYFASFFIYVSTFLTYLDGYFRCSLPVIFLEFICLPMIQGPIMYLFFYSELWGTILDYLIFDGCFIGVLVIGILVVLAINWIVAKIKAR